jgi:hypothetical protein
MTLRWRKIGNTYETSGFRIEADRLPKMSVYTLYAWDGHRWRLVKGGIGSLVEAKALANPPEDHGAYVSIPTADLADRSKPLRYRVKCPTCGQVGQPQEHQGDAQAIADRHREVGGFERRSA